MSGKHQPRSGMCLSWNEDWGSTVVPHGFHLRSPPKHGTGGFFNDRRTSKISALEPTWKSQDCSRYSRCLFRTQKYSEFTSWLTRCFQIFYQNHLCPQRSLSCSFSFWLSSGSQDVSDSYSSYGRHGNPDVQMDWWQPKNIQEHRLIQLIPWKTPMTSIEAWQFTQLLFKCYTCHPSVEDKMWHCFVWSGGRQLQTMVLQLLILKKYVGNWWKLWIRLMWSCICFINYKQ